MFRSQWLHLSTCFLPLFSRFFITFNALLRHCFETPTAITVRLYCYAKFLSYYIIRFCLRNNSKRNGFEIRHTKFESIEPTNRATILTKSRTHITNWLTKCKTEDEKKHTQQIKLSFNKGKYQMQTMLNSNAIVSYSFCQCDSDDSDFVIFNNGSGKNRKVFFRFSFFVVIFSKLNNHFK